jgi:hypothetical protein
VGAGDLACGQDRVIWLHAPSIEVGGLGSDAEKGREREAAANGVLHLAPFSQYPQL